MTPLTILQNCSNRLGLSIIKNLVVNKHGLFCAGIRASFDSLGTLVGTLETLVGGNASSEALEFVEDNNVTLIRFDHKKSAIPDVDLRITRQRRDPSVASILFACLRSPVVINDAMAAGPSQAPEAGDIIVTDYQETS